MIITKENELFQQLLADVSWLKSVVTEKYTVNYGKYIIGCDPYKEESPIEFKEGDWVYRTVGKDDDAHAYGRRFKIKFISPQIVDENGITHFKCSLRHATDDEIKEHLVAIAKAKGYRDGMTIERLNDKCSNYIQRGNLEERDYFFYRHNLDRLEMNGTGIYQDGQWAKMVKQNKKKLPKTKAEFNTFLGLWANRHTKTTDEFLDNYEV